MRLIKYISILLPFLAMAQASSKLKSSDNFFICYGKIAPEKVFGYDLVILESQLYTSEEINAFKSANDKVVGYISLTEVHPTSNIYSGLEDYTFGKNEVWGSYYIDLKQKKAQEVLLKEVSRIMKMGLDGLFLDNIDNVSDWGVLKDQKRSLVNLIKNIKKQHADIYMVQNAGLFLSKDLKKYTDAVLIESVITLYNFNEAKYAFRDKASRNKMFEEILKVHHQQIYILEYANTDAMKLQVESELDNKPYSYFIANIDLQTEPKFQSKK